MSRVNKVGDDLILQEYGDADKNRAATLFKELQTILGIANAFYDSLTPSDKATVVQTLDSRNDFESASPLVRDYVVLILTLFNTIIIAWLVSELLDLTKE